MEITENSKPLVLDGGFGSSLELFNLNVQNSDMWSFDAAIDNPELVFQVHKKFIEAGAQIILTNTYHAALDLMEKCRGYSEEAGAAAIVSAVDIAKAAARESGRDVLVVGSIGPYAIVRRDGSEYSGDYVQTLPRQTIWRYYAKQMEVMLSTELDWCAIETVPTLKEALIALDVWKSLPAAANKKLWISFSCKDSYYTCGNDPFSDCAERLSTETCVSAIGINCTAPSDILPLVASAGSHAKGKPFVVYPNHGEKYDIVKQDFDLSGPDTFPKYLQNVPHLLEMNVKVFGGCCRVQPKHIQQLKLALEDAIHSAKSEFD